MLRRVAISSAIFIFALGILFTSILRTAAVRYETNGVTSSNVLGTTDYAINYNLAYEGRILPDSIMWPLKALRDKVWLLITTNKEKKVELKILFADKRLGGAQKLFNNKKNEVALAAATKAEKYLEEASLEEERQILSGKEPSIDILTHLANASLKHYEVLLEIQETAPDDMKATLMSTQQIPIKSYERARNALLSEGVEPPINPFKWD